MSKKRLRRSYSSAQKAAILRRHLVDKVPVSDLCDEYELQPSVFYGWQRQLVENMEIALSAGTSRRKVDSREVALTRENEVLRAKLAKKDNVIAEVSEAFVALKKQLGEP